LNIIDIGFFKIIIKTIAITYISELSICVCKENGYISLATIIDMFSRLAIVGISIPLVKELISMVNRCLS